MPTFTATKAERAVIQQSIIEALESEEDVGVAYLHGSFKQGRFRDIDIAVILEPRSADPAKIESRLERRLREETGFPIDLRRLNDAPLMFQYDVLAKGEILVSKDDATREDFQCRTLALYHDFSHHIRTYQREALGLST